MLTIHKPIGIKTARNILQWREGLAQRIQANYEMMAVKLTAADMLHLLTAPLNVYLYEGGTAPLAERSDRINNRIVKLQLINNMLNRIFVSDVFPMTYQDSVFVTHIMNKIGVANVKKFVRQLWLMQKDIRNVRRLTALYQSERQMLKAFREHQKETLVYKKEQNSEKTKEQESEYWLHQNILERLRTGEIYRDVCNFTVAAYGAEGEIHTDEIRISEQMVSAWSILLNQLKNEAHTESQILVYDHFNSYELGDAAFVNENYEQIAGDMIGAVLLNVLTQAYAVCLERHMRMENNWYALISLLCQSAQNTLSRFENCHNRFQLSTSGREEYFETLQRYQRAEIHMLQQIFERQDTALFHMDNRHTAAASEYQYDTVSQYGTFDITQNNDILLLPADVTEHYAISGSKADSNKTVYEEQLLKQLETIERNNLERMERIRQLSVLHSKDRSQKINMEKAREDGLRAIRNPDLVRFDNMYLEHHSHIADILQDQELRQILGEETVRAFETIQKLQEHGGSSSGMETESVKAFDLLVHDVTTVWMLEQIRRMNAKQYAEGLESAKSVIHTDLETKYRREYDTSVINWKKTADVHNNIREHYNRMHSQTQRREKIIGKRLELFHKQTDSKISEEMLGDLIRSSRQVHAGSTEVTDNFRGINSVMETVNDSVHEIALQRKEEIEQVVVQNINRQLGELSDQVYAKLERRMDSERRRRGL